MIKKNRNLIKNFLLKNKELHYINKVIIKSIFKMNNFLIKNKF